jgi:predicted adenine nucleotide alpha hydrolase (AANH) superfamily ATPase
MHCLERYSALRPIDIIYDKEYKLAKYLVNALEAMYDPETEYKYKPSAKKKDEQRDGGFHEKVSISEKFEIRLTPRNDVDNSQASSFQLESLKLEQKEDSDNSKESSSDDDSDFNPRCGYCISMRLARTAEVAAKGGFDAFTTTLLESKYQPHDYIQSVGEKFAAENGIEFYYEDFRKGWKESIQISKELQLYRQQYCGCIFSEYERFGPD